MPAPSDAQPSPLFSRDLTSDAVRLNMPRGNLDAWLTVETCRRATRLILALEAWKLEHGGLPPSLDDLKGKYLDQLPVDPYRGDPFSYEPRGRLNIVAWRSPNSAETKTIQPGQPFLACVYWTTQGSAAGSDECEPPAASAVGGPAGTKVREDVWLFPIP